MDTLHELKEKQFEKMRQLEKERRQSEVEKKMAKEEMRQGRLQEKAIVVGT